MSTRKGDGVAPWRRVLALSQYDPDSGCVHWTGSVTLGYGRVWTISGANLLVHRVMYQAMVGMIPDGLEVGHLCHDRAVASGACTGGLSCRHRRCVRPDHLGPQTSRENVLASRSTAGINAAKVQCVHGHPFDAANTYWRPKGGRTCRTCRDARDGAAALRKRASNVVGA